MDFIHSLNDGMYVDTKTSFGLHSSPKLITPSRNSVVSVLIVSGPPESPWQAEKNIER